MELATAFRIVLVDESEHFASLILMISVTERKRKRRRERKGNKREKGKER